MTWWFEDKMVSPANGTADTLLPPPRNPAAPPGPIQSGIAAGLKAADYYAGLPSRYARGVEPTVPGMWSEEDEFRQQRLQKAGTDWGVQSGLGIALDPLGVSRGVGGGARGIVLGSGAGGGKIIQPQPGATAEPIRAYHSSPHDFERFDTSKIGTGEGAQAFGHGLYFAENPAVSGQGGQYWNQFMRRFEGPERSAAEYMMSAGFDRGKALKAIETDIERLHENPAWKEVAPEGERVLRQQMRLIESGKPIGPRTYEVNINARPDQLLNYDVPIKEQAIAGKIPEPLLEAARNEAYSRALGASSASRADQLWRMAKDPLEAPGEFILGKRSPQVSAALSEAGIPGIRYLDQGARMLDPSQLQQVKQAIATVEKQASSPTQLLRLRRLKDEEAELLKEKTSNIVIFPGNEHRIDILRKFAIPGMAGALGTYLQDRQQ